VAARQAFEQAPKDLGALLKFSDALAADSCFDDAVHVLEDGEATHGRNAELQAHLREARSMLSEQHYFDSLDRAGEAAKLSRNLLRCRKLADLQACDDALAQKPNDLEIMLAKGDALLQAKRPADAMRAYGQARQVANGDTAVDEKLAAAESQRRAFLNACQLGNGESALQACEGALIRGDASEFDILKRKGILLQGAGQAAPALDAYISADLLRHGDRSIALAIVALSESTGRGDALTLAAHGSALLTLDRPAEALVPLRQALTLSPGLIEAKARLARAERSAAAAGSKQSAARQTLASAQVAAASEAANARRYSNAAPFTRSN
jgi:tetratricopeptide (TPR) repeat protein